MRKIIGLLLILMCVFIPFSIKALTANTTLTCAKTNLKKNESSKCTIKVEVKSGSLSSFDGTVTVSSNLTLSDATKASGWEGDVAKNSGVFKFYTSSLKTGTVTIATFVVKATSDADSTETITLGSLSLGDENFNENSQSKVERKITIQETVVPTADDLYLKTLKIKGAVLEPKFNKNVLSYNCVTNESSVTISATGTGTISGTGTKKLSNGKNTFKITLSDSYGNKKTYTVVVTKTDAKVTSKYAKIESLSINGYDLNFESETLDYELNVSADTKVLDFEVNLDADDGRYEILNNNDLKNGQTITIKVTSYENNVVEYNIKIIKPEEDNSGSNFFSENSSLFMVIGGFLLLSLILGFIYKRKSNQY